MTKDEFIKTCVICGYASKKNATNYAEGREILTEDDFEKVHLFNERMLDIKFGPSRHSCCQQSAENLLDSLNNIPAPWNHIFDTSRGVKR